MTVLLRELISSIESSFRGRPLFFDGGAFGGAPGRPGMAAPAPTQANLDGTADGVGTTVVAGVLQVADLANPNGGEGNVHIHRNALGDSDPTGGASDLDSSIHRWLNPVARVVVTVR